MSVGIVRVAKMTSGSVKGIEIHDKRKKDISHTNKDIDWSRSSENYDLHYPQNENFTKAVKERISALTLKRAVRKDAVVMAQVLVTSDHAFFTGLSEKQQTQFFEDSYNFLAERYGRENVVAATVHLDEKTPHMHFNFVPVTADGRLSAKSILTKQSLIEQQTAFQEQVGKHYGLERGLQGGKKKHLEMFELKAQTALESVSKAQERLQGIEDSLKPLKAEYEAKKAYLRACEENSTLSVMYPAWAEQKKSLLGKETVTVPKEQWEARHVAADKKSYLAAAEAALEKALEEFQRTATADTLKRLEQNNAFLSSQLAAAQNEMANLRKDAQRQAAAARTANNQVQNALNRINRVLAQLPPEATTQFLSCWEQEQAREAGYDLDR